MLSALPGEIPERLDVLSLQGDGYHLAVRLPSRVGQRARERISSEGQPRCLMVLGEEFRVRLEQSRALGEIVVSKFPDGLPKVRLSF